MTQARIAAQGKIVGAHGGFETFLEQVFTLSIEQLAALAHRGARSADHLVARGQNVVPALN